MKDIIKNILGEKVINFYHYLWSLFSAIFYRFPAKKIKTITITGTKGKTSTSYILWKILNENGIKTGLLTTAIWSFDGKNIKINNKHMTMPGHGFVQKSIKKMLQNNCEVAIIETTSEGIKQYRHKFLFPYISVFTNLYPEHIQSHGGFENYKKTKGKLFKENPNQIKVLNKDSEHFDYFNKFKSKKTITFGKNKDSDFVISDIKVKTSTTSFKINDEEFKIHIPGEVYTINTCCALSIFSNFKEIKYAKEIILKIKNIPGRMEEINMGQDFRVFIDYAHEPVSLEKTLKTARKLAEYNQLIVVFGATGGIRDKQKRPKMGEVAEKYADIIILTDDDPYNENSEKIIQDIKKGIKNKQKIYEIIDRKKAIKKAIVLANPGDIVIIAGKGSETFIIKNNQNIPHNDKVEAEKSIKEILSLQ